MGYVYQCSLIKKRKSLGSFSINLCGMLLFCNILRIGFYFFKQYAFALLAQSIFMTAVQVNLSSHSSIFWNYAWIQWIKKVHLINKPKTTKSTTKKAWIYSTIFGNGQTITTTVSNTLHSYCNWTIHNQCISDQLHFQQSINRTSWRSHRFHVANLISNFV